MSITINDIKAGPAHLEHKLSLDPDARLADLTEKAAKGRISAVESFCLGYLSQQLAKKNAKAAYEQAAQKLKKGEPAFYACYQAAILAQHLDYPWPKVEQQLLQAFQILPTRGEPILRIIHHYQEKQQWPIAYLFSKFAKKQFHDKLPKARNWGFDKSLYTWKMLDIHKVSCYAVEKFDEATAAYSTLCRLISENPGSFLVDDITRIARQKFLFPGFASYEKDRTQYHLQ
jgi:hypothetical protein